MATAEADVSTGAVRQARPAISADRLAAVLDVPQSIFSFLEARVPEVRAIASGGGRVYRAQDAVLLAGLADMLYREGHSFRDVAQMLHGPERRELIARGRARLRGALGSDAPAPRARHREIPNDAVVTPKGRARDGNSGVRTAPSAEISAVLSELIDCVRLLEDAR